MINKLSELTPEGNNNWRILKRKMYRYYTNICFPKNLKISENKGITKYLFLNK